MVTRPCATSTGSGAGGTASRSLTWRTATVPFLANRSFTGVELNALTNQVGIMIDCKRNIPSGEVYHLRLDLMEGIAEKPEVEFTAECKWCRSDKIQPYLYNAGFAITEISDEDREIVARIAEKYGSGG